MPRLMLIIGSGKQPTPAPVPPAAPAPAPSVGAVISNAVRQVLTLKKGGKRGNHKKK